MKRKWTIISTRKHQKGRVLTTRTKNNENSHNHTSSNKIIAYADTAGVCCWILKLRGTDCSWSRAKQQPSANPILNPKPFVCMFTNATDVHNACVVSSLCPVSCQLAGHTAPPVHNNSCPISTNHTCRDPVYQWNHVPTSAVVEQTSLLQQLMLLISV